MKPVRAALIALFSDFSSQYTIHEAAKLVGKSYGLVYAEMQGLIKRNILDARQVGHALLCSLNPDALEDPEIMGYFVHQSLLQRSQYLKRHSVPEAVMQLPVIFVFEKKYYTLQAFASHFTGKEDSLVFLSLSQLQDFLAARIKNSNLSLVIILSGSEFFWRKVAWLKRR
ncbi:MAG: hypothetical protein QW594_01170 [Candidatus Woesearchaeota archaeon]